MGTCIVRLVKVWWSLIETRKLGFYEIPLLFLLRPFLKKQDKKMEQICKVRWMSTNLKDLLVRWDNGMISEKDLSRSLESWRVNYTYRSFR